MIGRAPGRLDLLGGVADYAGALVLETPTRAATTVTVRPADALVVGPVRLTAGELRSLAAMPYRELRAALAEHPTWTHYILGVALVLIRHGVIDPPSGAIEVASDVPQSVGVSSSAALEVATARALGADAVDPLRLAALCQEAENQVVGAPCGIMDQVTVAMGVRDALLPILCRPAAVRAALPLPPDVQVVGWPTGVQHAVSGAAYRRARVAAFMGKRIAEASSGRAVDWVSQIPPPSLAALPELLSGAEFLARWRRIDDSVTSIDEHETYPVRAAASFGVQEHRRCEAALSLVAARRFAELAPLLAASHAGYDAIGLGHPAATAIVSAAVARPGVYGARSSGGGCGGTVVVICRRGALDDVAALIR